MKKFLGILLFAALFVSFGVSQNALAEGEFTSEDEGVLVNYNPEEEEDIIYTLVEPDIVYGEETPPLKKEGLFSKVTNYLVAAESEDPDVLESEEVVVYEYDDNPGISVRLVESALENRNPYGVLVNTPEYGQTGRVYEKYSHSYYTYSSRSITDYNVGPRSGDEHIISVARGSSKTTSHSTTIYGKVTISGEANIPKALAKVIKAGLSGNIEGSVKYTFKSGKTYKGPASTSKYNTRDFYGAYQKDKLTTSSKKYDVYDVYNGKVKTGTKTYYKGIIKTNGVKLPKSIEYSKDFKN
ncbi:MAG: hypothetical protein ACI33J_00315 [Clostridium sp.]